MKHCIKSLPTNAFWCFPDPELADRTMLNVRFGSDFFAQPARIYDWSHFNRFGALYCPGGFIETSTRDRSLKTENLIMPLRKASLFFFGTINFNGCIYLQSG